MWILKVSVPVHLAFLCSYPRLYQSYYRLLAFLVRLFALYAPPISSFTPNQFFVIKCDSWLLVFSSKFIRFWYSIFSLYILLWLSKFIIIWCCCSGSMYTVICTVLDFFYLCEYLLNYLHFHYHYLHICNFIFILACVASAAFWTTLSLWRSLKDICRQIFFVPRNFCLYLLFRFLPMFSQRFFAKDKNP